MSTQELDELILAADAEKCADFFLAKSEKERKAYAERAVLWTSATNGYSNRRNEVWRRADKAIDRDMTLYESIQAGKIDFPKEFTDASLPAVLAAALSTCALPELKRVGHLGLPTPDLATRILLARRPPWLDKWCLYILKDFPATHWMTVYELEKSGACTLERTPDYWMAMVCSLAHAGDMYEKILSQDERIRSEIWPMLADPAVARMLAEPEQMGHDFRKRWNSAYNIFGTPRINTRKGTNAWRNALVRLGAENLIDNQRLIEYSFTNLAQAGEKEYKKMIYGDHSSADYAIQLNQDLTKENTAAYINQYIALLGAAHKDVSTYASTVLSAMPTNSVSVEEVCACIAPAFLNKSKEPADAALKLLTQLAKQTPSKRAAYGPAILAAFGHSSKDIHKKALALVESTNLLEDPTLLAEFHQRMDMLGGMERTSAAQLAAKYAVAQEDTAGDSAQSAAIDTTNESDLFRRAEALDKSLRKLSRIDEAIEAMKNGTRLDAPVLLDSNAIPRLNPNAAIKPISGLDDLIYKFAQVWSARTDPLDVEAALDGVSRLCHERPPDFEQKTDVLRQKAHQPEQDSFFSGMSRIFGHIACCWLGMPPSGESAAKGPPSPDSFFARRCLAVAKRAQSRQNAPLLSAPTHAGGWIDPAVLVKRMLEYSRMKVEPYAEDFIQALLRMAPDNRADALVAAAPLKSEMGAALRYALGSDTTTPLVTPEYWVAAYRAREPKGTNVEFLTKWPNLGPDGAQAARYGLDLQPLIDFNNDRYASISAGLPNFLPLSGDYPGFSSAPKKPPTTMLGAILQRAELKLSTSSYQQCPTVLLHENTNTWVARSGIYDWLHNRESVLALFAKRMLQNIESVGSYWHGGFDFLFDPDISMSDNGRFVILFAMSSKNNDLSRLAVDALIAAIGECRICADTYGEAMAQVLPTGVCTAVRWTRGLRDASRTSLLHVHFVWQALSSMIANVKIDATKQIPFLELLVELQVEHGFKPDSALAESLSAHTGASKSAKLAKTLLSYAQPDKTTAKAALEDLESRINRVERWQSWIREGSKKEAVV